jgi:hypothetical protein
MLVNWPKHFAPNKHKYSEKLVGRIFKGIPNSIRNAAWYKLLDVESQIKAQQGVYEVCDLGLNKKIIGDLIHFYFIIFSRK